MTTTAAPPSIEVHAPGRARRWVLELPILPLLILVPFALAALFADFVAPYDPTEPVRGAKMFVPPFWMDGGSTATLLGTDFQGRDSLSRLIHGARVSLIVGLMGTVVAGGLGTALGILSGYLGGWLDQAIMRLTDAWLALPALVFAIFLATVVGPSMWNIVIILGLVYWTRYARVIRGEVLSLREREYVQLAEIAGASRLRVILRHILPNVLNTAMVLASLHHRRRDHCRGVAELPGGRRAAAGARLGPDAVGGALDVDGRQMVADGLSGRLHPAGRAGHATARRLVAHPPRSPAAQPLARCPA